MTSAQTQLTDLKSRLTDAINAANDLTVLNDLRVSALGKKGDVTALLREIPNLPPEERKDFGQSVNALKTELSDLLETRLKTLKDAALETRLATEKFDMSLPARAAKKGSFHPITQTIYEVLEIMAEMGFHAVTGPELEDEDHNFTRLNFGPNHPARQMHDTFYIDEGEHGDPENRKLLRTHTSTVQVRTMMSQKPPIRVVVPGPTFRSDYDQTHTPMFNQIECLAIDKHLTMGHLKHTLQTFLARFFGVEGELPIRLRPNYFPFTEPSAEVDVRCAFADGQVKIGEGNKWMEILGCGMVHPNVIRNCDLDPAEWQGYAFGVGVERLAMLKYGAPDLRDFFNSDLRWLRHYGFSLLDLPRHSLAA